MGAPFLDSVLPEHLQSWVDLPMKRLLRDSSEFEELFPPGALPEPYWDPVLLHSRRKYLQLMRALVRCGLVRALPGGSALERAAIFL